MVLDTMLASPQYISMKATKLFHSKDKYGRGLIEIVIWKTPKPVTPSDHFYKYSLVYIVDGVRVVGYDNEKGKGDHKHLYGQEENYEFISTQQLVADFMGDVKEVNKHE